VVTVRFLKLGIAAAWITLHYFFAATNKARK
jgi:hypothetical protein